MQPVSPRASRFHVAVLAAAGLATFTGAPTARAQQPAATSGGLEEVIVTAQKREQNLQEIGISLSAVSGSDLTDLGVVNATDITKSMPAVVLTQPNGPSSFSLAIRGVVQNDFADHQESPAAIYVDDVYVSQMIGLAFSTFDIDRVEVLRGPQGTLFGRNATGGLAHFISRRPTDEPSGYMDVTLGQRSRLTTTTRCSRTSLDRRATPKTATTGGYAVSYSSSSPTVRSSCCSGASAALTCTPARGKSMRRSTSATESTSSSARTRTSTAHARAAMPAACRTAARS